MKRVKWSQFRNDESAAVAPTIALSLFALIAVGGIGFDYARMAAMDSELQNAADQAALAAATQLDGEANAITRARTAAQSLVTNSTLFANDAVGIAIDIPAANVVFYVDKAKTTVATIDEDANFVEVTTVTREANFALTPIVDALSSGPLEAIAFAGLNTAICKVPPVMICNPYESDGTLTFNANLLRGHGMRLITGSSDAPGNFGFLETGFGTGAQNLARALGFDGSFGGCSPGDGVETKPGMNDVVLNAFNTRFDLDISGENTCPSGGTCSSAINSRKDLVRKSGMNSCGIVGNGWQESPNPYRPTTTAPLTSGYPDIMGHPRDICHAISLNGSCSTEDANGRIGDGVWDRDAYFRVNYGYTSTSEWMIATGLSDTATRYEVYKWELTNPLPLSPQGPFAGANGYHYPVCRPSAGVDDPDRRVITAAVINCADLGLSGGSDTDIPVFKWIDLFLVEPAYARKRGSTLVTDSKDVYVEIIRESVVSDQRGPGTRKVPYLIE